MNTKLLLSVILLFFTALFSQAQVSYPYFSGFDNAAEQQGWQQYEKGVSSMSDWEYDTFQSFSSTTSLVHYYPVGGSQLTVDWMVSPKFDFSLGGSIDSLRYYFSGFGTPQPDDTVAIYLLQGSKNPDSATATLLFDFRDTIYKADNTWRKLEALNIPATNQDAYLAFKYVTTVNWLDVRFDNIAVSGNGIGIAEKEPAKNVFLFPNPTQNELSFAFTDKVLSSSEKVTLKIFDMQGKLVLKETGSMSDKWNVSALKGMYLYTLLNSNSEVLLTEKVLIKAY